jgi:hypothetical protein
VLKRRLMLGWCSLATELNLIQRMPPGFVFTPGATFSESQLVWMLWR